MPSTSSSKVNHSRFSQQSKAKRSFVGSSADTFGERCRKHRIWNIWNTKQIYSISGRHMTPDSRTHWLFTSFAHLFLSANLQHDMSLSMAWSLLSQALIFGDSKTKKKWSPSAWQVEWKRIGQRIHRAWRELKRFKQCKYANLWALVLASNIIQEYLCFKLSSLCLNKLPAFTLYDYTLNSGAPPLYLEASRRKG